MAQPHSDPDAFDAPPQSDFREVVRDPGPAEVPDFAQLYEDYVDFVFRSVRRLGIAPSLAEDVTQEVFLTIHRRLSTFEGRSSLKTWIFGVTLGVVRNQRRAAARHRDHRGPSLEDDVAEPEAPSAGPHEEAERRDAVRILHQILDDMDDDKRAIFVLADLEGVPPADIAAHQRTKLFTTYSRLRAARAQFKKLAARFAAIQGWGAS